MATPVDPKNNHVRYGLVITGINRLTGRIAWPTMALFAGILLCIGAHAPRLSSVLDGHGDQWAAQLRHLPPDP